MLSDLMSLILVLLAIFLSTGLLSREIERRTIFMVVTKPVSRGEFLLARLAGNMLTLSVLLVLMGALLLATVMLAPQGFVLGIGKLVVDRWTGRRQGDPGSALADASRLQSDET